MTDSNAASAAGPPRWLIPAAVATLIVLLIGLLVFVFSGDDDATPAETVPATDPPTTSPQATEPSVTDPPATELPAETSPPPTEPPRTDPPLSTPVSGTEPVRPDDVASAELATLQPGQVSISGPFGSSLFDVAVACESTDSGFEIVSSLLTNPEGDIVLAEVYSGETGAPFLLLSHMNAEIDRLFSGSDDGTGAQWLGTLSDGLPLDQRTLLSVNDAGFGGVSISMHAPEPGECTTGFLASPWLFAPVLKPEFIERSNGVWDETRGFAVLAKCGAGLIISGAGVLSALEVDGNLGAAVLFVQGDDIRFFATPDPFEPNGFLVEQDESSGDVTFIVRVEEVGSVDRNEGYLTWNLAGGDGIASVKCAG